MSIKQWIKNRIVEYYSADIIYDFMEEMVKDKAKRFNYAFDDGRLYQFTIKWLRRN